MSLIQQDEEAIAEEEIGEAASIDQKLPLSFLVDIPKSPERIAKTRKPRTPNPRKTVVKPPSPKTPTPQSQSVSRLNMPTVKNLTPPLTISKKRNSEIGPGPSTSTPAKISRRNSKGTKNFQPGKDQPLILGFCVPLKKEEKVEMMEVEVDESTILEENSAGENEASPITEIGFGEEETDFNEGTEGDVTIIDMESPVLETEFDDETCELEPSSLEITDVMTAEELGNGNIEMEQELEQELTQDSGNMKILNNETDQFQQNHEKFESRMSPTITNSVSTLHFPPPLKRKYSKTQIDEITSSLPKPRSRASSGSSRSSNSESSTKKSRSSCFDVTTALARKEWPQVFEHFIRNLQNENKHPTHVEFSIIIRNCLLKMDGRGSSRGTQAAASNFFENFVKFTGGTKVELIFQALDLVEPKHKNTNQCYWFVISKLLDQVKEDAQNNLLDRAALKFLQQLFIVMKISYQEWSKQEIKFHRPSIARIFEGEGEDSLQISKRVSNFKCLVHHLFALEKYHEEMKLCSDWVNETVPHYKKYNVNKKLPKELVIAFVEVVYEGRNGEGHPDYGLNLLRGLNMRFAGKVILKILEREIIELNCYAKDARKKFLAEIANTSAVLMHEAVGDSFQKTNSTLRGSATTTNYTISKINELTYTNKKGENKLHLVCGGRGSSFENLEPLMEEMRKKHDFDINVRDNVGNTPLHEAAYHNRVDVLKLFREKFYSGDEEPGPLNVNIWAKDDKCNTPLHLAAMRGHKMFIEILIEMCNGDKEKKCRLLMSKDSEGNTPLDISDETVQQCIEKHMPIMEEEFNFTEIDLSEESMAKLKNNENLQKLIAYWYHISQKKMN